MMQDAVRKGIREAMTTSCPQNACLPVSAKYLAWAIWNGVLSSPKVQVLLRDVEEEVFVQVRVNRLMMDLFLLKATCASCQHKSIIKHIHCVQWVQFVKEGSPQAVGAGGWQYGGKNVTDFLGDISLAVVRHGQIECMSSL